MAGLARIIPYLSEKDKNRDWYINLLRPMSISISQLQSEDGFWRSSLLDPAEYPDHPETSGSNFYCFAIAWGINH